MQRSPGGPARRYYEFESCPRDGFRDWPYLTLWFFTKFFCSGFVRNINAGPEDLEIPEKISINDLSPLELKAFVEKVKEIATSDYFYEEEVDYREHVALKEELSRTDVSEDGALKHARQQVRYFVDTLFIMATR